jgi:hypothetical protein
MAKAVGFNSPTVSLPPQWQPLLEKILRWYDNQIYPVWCPFNFHQTRSAKKRLKEKTQLPKVSDAWKQLTPAQKQAWKNAKGYTGLTGYQVFTADFIYRRNNGLPLPGTPSTTHQVYGLMFKNEDGVANVYARLHEKDLIGPLKIKFFYKKREYIADPSKSFKFTAFAYYFEGGLNVLDQTQWIAPSGNQNWQQVSLNFGREDRKYFHLTLSFDLGTYQAAVYIDNFKLEDKNGAFYTESFNKKSKKEWNYNSYYRKRGWAFYPFYGEPYIKVVYLDQ